MFNRSKIQIYEKREIFNADTDDQLVGYVSGSKSIDSYNANQTTYLKMYQKTVMPLSTVLIYKLLKK